MLRVDGLELGVWFLSSGSRVQGPGSRAQGYFSLRAPHDEHLKFPSLPTDRKKLAVERTRHTEDSPGLDWPWKQVVYGCIDRLNDRLIVRYKDR